jgi:hypothetical protein
MTFLRSNSSPTIPKASIALANVSAYAPTTAAGDGDTGAAVRDDRHLTSA